MDVMTSESEAEGLALLETLAVQEAALFAAQARQLHASAVLSEQLQGPDGLDRFLVIDVAGTLRIGQLAAGHRLAQAERLVLTLTHTLAALGTGAVLVPQARVVLEETDSCSPAVAAEVDQRLHAGAPDGLAGWTGRRLHHRLKRLVLVVEAEREPGATAERLETARRGRRVSVRPEPDGMASLWALLPAEQLRQFTLGLDELTRRQRQADVAAGVERTADQRRADLLALLPALALHALDGTTPGPGCGHPAVVLTVHVPLATALGRSQAPAELDGYGPISAAAARRLLPGAALRRVLVDEAGRPVDVDDVLCRPGVPEGEGMATARARAAALADPDGADPDGADTDRADTDRADTDRADRHRGDPDGADRHRPTVTEPTSPGTAPAHTSPASYACGTRCAPGRAARPAAPAATSTTIAPGPPVPPRRTTSSPAAAGATGPRP